MLDINFTEQKRGMKAIIRSIFNWWECKNGANKTINPSGRTTEDNFKYLY
ncbi:MAG: hypothetical protein HQL02_12930 [Nitrospirae bacterium]|nr:hypothetical protein [Nitrospirota bacterium]